MTYFIQSIFAQLSSLDLSAHTIDPVRLQWFEATRRIMRKTTQSGRELAFRLLSEGQSLSHGDVLWMDAHTAIVIEIEPCEVIVLSPKTLPEMARVCYEIGNKHAPLFLDGEDLLMPPDEPLFRWLTQAGFAPYKDTRRLQNALRANSAHGHGAHGQGHNHVNVSPQNELTKQPVPLAQITDWVAGARQENKGNQGTRA